MPRTQTLRHASLVGGILAGLMLSTVAFAGECPADQMVADSSAKSDAGAKDVTDTVIGSIDLAEEAPMLDGRLFRLRKLEIQPGGIVPWHSHEKRPALIYVVEGEIVEHSSTCAMPITHVAGDVAQETRAVSHWWENTGTKPVVLLSADIFPEEMDPGMM
ncbi:MAG: cupin domain-containing protein [Paracoccaceae bacterium]